jgi:hypothetical protein
MKACHRHGALLVAGVVAFLGCSSKQDPTAELQKAAVALEKSDASTAPSPATGDGPASVSPSQQLKGAMEDYKAGKMEDAVTRLQLLRSATALSPEQRMALQDSIAAVMAEIYALAEKGDKRAIAAVAQYERMQTGR